MITNYNIKILLTISFVLICVYFLCKDNLEGFQIDVSAIDTLCEHVEGDCDLPDNMGRRTEAWATSSGYNCSEPSAEEKSKYQFVTSTCTGQTSGGVDCAENAAFIAEPIEANCPTGDGCEFSETGTSFNSEDFSTAVVGLNTDQCVDDGLGAAYKSGDINAEVCHMNGGAYSLSGCDYKCTKPTEIDFVEMGFMPHDGVLGTTGDDYLTPDPNQDTANGYAVQFSHGATDSDAQIKYTGGVGGQIAAHNNQVCKEGWSHATGCYDIGGHRVPDVEGGEMTMAGCHSFHQNEGTTGLCPSEGNCPAFISNENQYVAICGTKDDDGVQMPTDSNTHYKIAGCVPSCNSRVRNNRDYVSANEGRQGAFNILQRAMIGITRGPDFNIHDRSSDQGNLVSGSGPTFGTIGDQARRELYQIRREEDGVIYTANRSPYKMNESSLIPGEFRANEDTSNTCYRKTIFYAMGNGNANVGQPGNRSILHSQAATDEGTYTYRQPGYYSEGIELQFGNVVNQPAVHYNISPLYDVNARDYDLNEIGGDEDSEGTIYHKCVEAGDAPEFHYDATGNEGESILVNFDKGHTGPTASVAIPIVESNCQGGENYSISGLYPVCPADKECLNFNISYDDMDFSHFYGIPYNLEEFRENYLGNKWLASELLKEEGSNITDTHINSLKDSLYYYRRYIEDDGKIHIEGQLRCDPSVADSCYISTETEITENSSNKIYDYVLGKFGQNCTNACEELATDRNGEDATCIPATGSIGDEDERGRASWGLFETKADADSAAAFDEELFSDIVTRAARFSGPIGGDDGDQITIGNSEIPIRDWGIGGEDTGYYMGGGGTGCYDFNGEIQVSNGSSHGANPQVIKSTGLCQTGSSGTLASDCNAESNIGYRVCKCSYTRS